MYRVIEVSNMLGVSKVTIYKKIDQLKREMKPYIKRRSNITYIEPEGVELLKASFENSKVHIQDDLKHKDTALCSKLVNLEERKLCSVNDELKLYMEMMKQEIDFLDHQIRLRSEERTFKELQVKYLKRMVKWNKSSISVLERLQRTLMKTYE